MKTLKDHWSAFYETHANQLAAHYPGLSIDRFFLEVSDILTKDLSQSLYSVSQKTLKELEALFLNGKPFPYILRESEFYHHHFFVNENVLIPRPETELLVDKLVRKSRKFSHMLDVGTGSGVILLSLVKAGVAEKGMGTDISDEALKVAGINQRRLRLNQKTKLQKSDRFQNITDKFDLIVSNPPYIKAKNHRSLVQSTVDAHEPHLALYLDDSTYDSWFHDFFNGVKLHLSAGGEFWMEGHEKELAGQGKLLRELGFQNVVVLQDYSGLDRFLSATSPA